MKTLIAFVASLFTLELSRRHDSRGFTLRTKLVTIYCHGWRIWRYQRRALVGWCLKVQIRQGAGYIGGSTGFIGWRTRGGRKPAEDRTAPPFRIGWTRNGNKHPYSFA